jgi:hypothetical protein
VDNLNAARAGSVRLAGMAYVLPLAGLGRRLTAAEAVGVLVEVGEELAALHATGGAHGGASAVMVDESGRTLLGPPVEGGEPAEDVRLLAVAVESGLAPDAPDLLRRLLATCRCPDPDGRPSAEELARLAARISRPHPIRLAAARRAPRVAPARAGALVLVALLLAVELGRVWGRGGEGPTALPPAPLPSPPASTASQSSEPAEAPTVTSRSVTSPGPLAASPKQGLAASDWLRVLASLDRARGRAWSTGTQAPLTSADAARSPALRHDGALARQLRSSGLYAEGWASRLGRVVVVRATASRVQLRVRDRLAGYVLRRADGAVAHRVAARGPRWWLVDLHATPDGWLTWAVLPAGSQRS